MLPLRRLIWNNYKLIQRTRFEDFRGGMLWLGKKNHYVKSHASNFTCVNRSSSRKSFKQPPIAHVLWVSMTFSLSDRLWCNRRLCPIKGPYMVNSNMMGYSKTSLAVDRRWLAFIGTSVYDMSAWLFRVFFPRAVLLIVKWFVIMFLAFYHCCDHFLREKNNVRDLFLSVKMKLLVESITRAVFSWKSYVIIEFFRCSNQNFRRRERWIAGGFYTSSYILKFFLE